jgi:AAA+ ATPase superfamily predicted ATPase
MIINTGVKMYRTSGIVTGKDFVDREDVLTELSKGVEKNNFILTGPRRIGKSSLLAELERRLAQKYVITNFSVAEVIPRTHQNFLRWLTRRILAMHLKREGVSIVETLRMGFRELIGALKKLKVDVLDLVTIYIEPDVKLTELVKSTCELSERLAEKANLDHMIMLDELLLLIRLPGGRPHPGDLDFMWTLREYMQRAKRTHYIISGSQVGMVKKLSLGEDSPFFGTFLVRQLKGIDEKSAEMFLARVKHKIKVKDELIHEIAERSRGIPLYLAAFGNAMLAIGEYKRILARGDFEAVAKRAFIDLRPQFDELLGKVTSSLQRTILGAMAVKGTGSVSEVASSLGKPYAAVYTSMERLELMGYLEKSGKGEFEFLDPLLEEFLKGQQSGA